ncbi:hypothetical protein SASPL_100993 [Salvia splendens]|uniref:Prephenate dehydratase domain-containing protein n=1 Tax=Salvia splendens TaxID=180675 RepID=A0A8X8YNF1_SALSN|nr:hypothetical protein SASPL_100993 [Salvia splendens]
MANQGVPGAYSEAAAGKAYPKCEAIPCDQFEVAFQAVDRAVLPVENSLGGSIHRNYDLLLRHRLHIALSQCEHTLTRMGLTVAREAVDDTAGAAEYIAANGLRDTEAELYRLQVVADGIQQRDEVRDAGEGADHTADGSALQDEYCVRAREARHQRALQDFEATMAEARAQNALTSFLRVLGSYPMDMTPWAPSSAQD